MQRSVKLKFRRLFLGSNHDFYAGRAVWSIPFGEHEWNCFNNASLDDRIANNCKCSCVRRWYAHTKQTISTLMDDQVWAQEERPKKGYVIAGKYFLCSFHTGLGLFVRFVSQLFFYKFSPFSSLEFKEKYPVISSKSRNFLLLLNFFPSFEVYAWNTSIPEENFNKTHRLSCNFLNIRDFYFHFIIYDVIFFDFWIYDVILF